MHKGSAICMRIRKVQILLGDDKHGYGGGEPPGGEPGGRAHANLCVAPKPNNNEIDNPAIRLTHWPHDHEAGESEDNSPGLH